MDQDGDEWADGRDNCPTIANANQKDTDGSEVGDACNDALDQDGDEWEDDRDNCPDDANGDQSDLDGDSVGDACDPYPMDTYNLQALADLELTQDQLALATMQRDKALADLEDAQHELGTVIVERDQALTALQQCQENPPFLDADGDGEHDQTDLCPRTITGESVDAAGCSITQFCAAIDATTPQGRRTCRLSDWNNDEQGNSPRDCVVDHASGACVPTIGMAVQQRIMGGARR